MVKLYISQNSEAKQLRRGEILLSRVITNFSTERDSEKILKIG